MQPTGSKAAGHPDIDRLERGRLLDQRHFEMLTSPEPQLAHWKGRGGAKLYGNVVTSGACQITRTGRRRAAARETGEP